MSAGSNRARPAANDGVVIAVHVKPRARRAGVLGRHGNGIKVAVRTAPERGRANEELITVLAQAFGVRRDRVDIVAGPGSQHKHVRFSGFDAGELQRRLRALLGETD